MYRSSNSVTDALTGLTLDLKASGSGTKDFSVAVDKASIKTEVESFITKYNDLLSYIQGKSTVDADAGVRGDFAADSTFRSLRFDMRNDVALEVTGQPSDGPKWITDLGITIEKDGSLKLTDADKLAEAVEDDAGAVESLFSGPNGVATRLETRIDRFVGINGIISDRNKSLEDNIKRLNNRISDWDERLGRREEQLRMQFARLQESIAVLQGQSQNMAMFFGGGF
jgi:flagellar hook-associated protein 2